MGLNSLLQQNMQSAGLAGIDRLAGNAMFPQSQMDKTQYAVPSQLPTSAETIRSDYDAKTDAYTGLPTIPFAKGGLAGLRFYDGGTPEEKNAIVADLYQKILGRSAGEGEASQWADYLNNESGRLDLARRLAQSEEGKAYAKATPESQYSNIAALSQEGSPFAETDTPYAKMEYLGPAFTTGDSDVSGHQFKDQQGGIVTVDAAGNPIKYAPGSAWYDEQLSKNPAALRGTDYRNQTYLAAGPLDKTYKFNGVDVPIEAAEFQVDPKTGQFVKGPTGENKPVEWRPKGYNMWDDWAAPAAVIAIPALAAAGVYAAGAYGAGAGLGAAEGATALGAAEGAGAAGAAGAGGAAAGGAGATTAGGITGSQALNTARGLMLAKSLINQMGGSSQQGYSGQGLNPNAGSIGFNPGTVSALGLPNVSAYEKTPWANLMPGITLSKLSEFAPDRDTKDMASGGVTGIGHLGGYSDGGRLLKGPGDGMSDNIPASISGKQPARLADGEFVVPADVVSHLGNGSTDAGAKQLYAMMDKVRKARTGNKKQGKQINPNKFLPKG